MSKGKPQRPQAARSLRRIGDLEANRFDALVEALYADAGLRSPLLRPEPGTA